MGRPIEPNIPNQQKPWKVQGVSRSTWFRRRAQEKGYRAPAAFPKIAAGAAAGKALDRQARQVLSEVMGNRRIAPGVRVAAARAALACVATSQEGKKAVGSGRLSRSR